VKVFGYKKNSKFINLPLFFLLYLTTAVYMVLDINKTQNTHFFLILNIWLEQYSTTGIIGTGTVHSNKQ
jgi:hypothetical protein